MVTATKKAQPRALAAAAAAPTEATSASAWQGKQSTGKVVMLPSGNAATLRAPGLQAFLAAGLIPNALLPIVTDALQKGKEPDEKALFENPDTLKQMSEFLDNVVVYVVVEPRILPLPVPNKETGVVPARDQDSLYVDDLGEEDKAFIFYYAQGGTADLATFRKEQASAVESVQSGQTLPKPAKRAGGAKSRPK